MRANRFPVIVSLALAGALGCATTAPPDESRDPTAPRRPLVRESAPANGSHHGLEETTRAERLPAALFDPAARLPAPELEYRGATALGLALRRLGATQRVLMIGAHPDDENTSLLAEFAVGRGADVGYLSLTRGEGGQNSVGPERQEALGLLRTEELLAARRLDGAIQFFTRAYDFGYSKTAEETFRQWPRDSVLGDVVRIIRWFRPDVVISVWRGTSADEHGHHQAAGILTREAFRLAADPAAFPVDPESGLGLHQPTILYVIDRPDRDRVRELFGGTQCLSALPLWRYFPPDPSALLIETGEYDPLLGMSAHQVAMRSRSRHRSQDQGCPEPAGPHNVALIPVSDTTGAHPAEGYRPLDIGLSDRARTLHARFGGTAETWQEVERRLLSYDSSAARARELSRLRSNDSLVPILAGMVATLDSVALADLPTAAAASLRFHLRQEREDGVRSLLLASGLRLTALSDDSLAVPGESIGITVRLWHAADAPIVVQRLGLATPEGWSSDGGPHPPSVLDAGIVLERAYGVRLPPDARSDQPYFLHRPRDGYAYVRGETEHWGLPFAPEPVRARALVVIGGAAVEVEAGAAYLGVDPRAGEFHRPLMVVPGLSLRLEPKVVVAPLPGVASVPTDAVAPRAGTPPTGSSTAGAAGPIELIAHLSNHGTEPVAGRLRIEGAESWLVTPREIRLRIDANAPPQPVPIQAELRHGSRAGQERLRLTFEADGRSFGSEYRRVAHPHVRSRMLLSSAESRLVAIDVRVPRDLRVGYLPGAGNETARALDQLGVDYEVLLPDHFGDLGRFDVVIFGPRAYDVRPILARYEALLEQFVRAGGTLIVQYNQYQFADSAYALLPLTMSRPHDRVTDETAPVRLLDPSHPLLSRPNRIGAADFEGWVQERGLYFAHTWDDAYTPLLEMADPGEAPLRGALLAARMGRGWYVYTGLALFRQLPAGVPGAYRLLANLLALGAD